MISKSKDEIIKANIENEENKENKMEQTEISNTNN